MIWLKWKGERTHAARSLRPKLLKNAMGRVMDQRGLFGEPRLCTHRGRSLASRAFSDWILLKDGSPNMNDACQSASMAALWPFLAAMPVSLPMALTPMRGGQVEHLFVYGFLMVCAMPYLFTGAKRQKKDCVHFATAPIFSGSLYLCWSCRPATRFNLHDRRDRNHAF